MQVSTSEPLRGLALVTTNLSRGSAFQALSFGTRLPGSLEASLFASDPQGDKHTKHPAEHDARKRSPDQSLQTPTAPESKYEQTHDGDRWQYENRNAVPLRSGRTVTGRRAQALPRDQLPDQKETQCDNERDPERQPDRAPLVIHPVLAHCPKRRHL